MICQSISEASFASEKLSRKQLRKAFLDSSPYAAWSLEALDADASFRTYCRLSQGEQRVLLMDSPPDKEDIVPYLAVDNYLLSIGLRAPRILHLDADNGFAIIEDFGLQTYTHLLNQKCDAKVLYTLAVDTLSHLHEHLSPSDVELPRYDDGFYEDEAALFIDWYWAARTGSVASPELRQEFLQIWADLLAKVSTDKECMVLRDYHVDNLILVDDAPGKNTYELSSCGLLDFQDALIGSRAYDLVSLLEDARREVDAQMSAELIEHFTRDLSTNEKTQFLYDYRVLGAHRHAKVIGIFVRLCVRDKKPHYLDYLPHVQSLFAKALTHPAMKPLADWLVLHHPGAVDEALSFDSDTVLSQLCA